MSNESIAQQAVAKVEIIINNNIPFESCPLKKQQAQWDKNKVLELVIAKLQAQIK